MKRLLIASAVLIALAACGSDDDGVITLGGTPAGHTVSGTVELTADWDSLEVTEPSGDVVTLANSHYRPEDGQWCQGAGGYSDMSEGSQVRITDAAGDLLAFGELQAGTLTKLDGPNFLCTLTFDVAGVGDSDTYQVEVSQRGGILFTQAEMEANGWTVGLTLGG